MLARNNSYLYEYISFVKKQGVLYRCIKNEENFTSSIQRELSVVRAFIYKQKHHIYPTDVDGMRVQQYLKEGYNCRQGEKWYESLNIDEDNVEYYQRLIDMDVNTDDVNVTISSIHGVKGGEADNVVVMLDMSRNTYKNYIINPDSELRVLYVACTRAKKNLFIYPTHKSKLGYDTNLKLKGYGGKIC